MYSTRHESIQLAFFEEVVCGRPPGVGFPAVAVFASAACGPLLGMGIPHDLRAAVYPDTVLGLVDLICLAGAYGYHVR